MKKAHKKLLISLTVAVALSSINNIAIAKDKKDKKQWFISNTVSVVDVDGDGDVYPGAAPAVLGKWAESIDRYDSPHDIPALQSQANANAAIVFIHDNWGKDSGEYHSDYHGITGQTERDSWVMTVYSNSANSTKPVNSGPKGDRKVTLSWKGFMLTPTESDGVVTYDEALDNSTLEKLSLIDLETLEVVRGVSAEGDLNHHTFTLADGKNSRNFRWVLGPINASYFEPASGAMQYIKEHQPHVLRQRKGVKKGGKFGMPPM